MVDIRVSSKSFANVVYPKRGDTSKSEILGRVTRMRRLRIPSGERRRLVSPSRHLKCLLIYCTSVDEYAVMRAFWKRKVSRIMGTLGFLIMLSESIRSLIPLEMCFRNADKPVSDP